MVEHEEFEFCCIALLRLRFCENAKKCQIII